MDNKFIKFTKYEKSFLYSVSFLLIAEILSICFTKICKIYDINLKYRMLIFIIIYFEIQFFKKAFGLIFEKNKVQK